MKVTSKIEEIEEKGEYKDMLKPNSRLVYDYVKENEGNNITANDIAAGTGLDVRQVNGIVTSAFQKKNLMQRTEAEIELPDNTHKKVKFISLTDAGKAFDPDAPETTEEVK